MDAATVSAITDFLRHVPAFAHLSTEERQQLAPCLQIKTLAAKAALFNSGDPYHAAIYILQRGDLRLHQARHQVRLQSGDFVGLLNALDGSAYASSAIAHNAVQLLQINAQRLQAIEHHCPPLFHSLRQFITGQLHLSHTGQATVSSRNLNLPARALMKSPLVTCSDSLTLQAAYQLMAERIIGSLGITDAAGQLRGLLTYQQLADAVLCQQHSPTTRLSQLTFATPLTARPDLPLWQIEEMQQEYQSKYVVIAEQGQPLGLISQTDLLRNIVTQHSVALAEITHASTIDHLQQLYQGLPTLAREVWEDNRRASTAVRIISEYHLALQRRCIELCLAEYSAEQGAAPARYAFIIFGSGSRKEMLLNPDQDNGLIIEDSPQLDAAGRAWFQGLSECVNQRLDAVGYRLCPGDIMARNPLFHKTLAEWQQQLTHILQQPTAKAARWANIVFDFDTLSGDESLAAELLDWLNKHLQQQPRLLQLMVEDDAESRAALGLFNRLIMTQKDDSGKGLIDIKRNGLRIITDAARIFALKYQIDSRNTVDRFAALVRHGVLADEFVRFVYGALDKSLDLLLRHQFRQLEQQQPLTKLIDPAAFSPIHYEALRMSMRAIKQLQARLQEEFDRVTF